MVTKGGLREGYGKYCIKCYEAWEESGVLYILNEACEKGNLDEYLIELARNQGGAELVSEFEVWKILLDMVRGVKHVHDRGFVHLDIKPSNFFVNSDGTIKLGDFG